MDKWLLIRFEICYYFSIFHFDYLGDWILLNSNLLNKYFDN
jgi:hypothetical protein